MYSTGVYTKRVLQVRSGERLDPAWEEAVVMRSQGRRRDSLEEDRYTCNVDKLVLTGNQEMLISTRSRVRAVDICFKSKA